MNSWSQRHNQFVQHKLLITLILGLIFLVPLIATAQEVTEEPQVDTVVTEEATEQPTQVTETEVVPEATEVTPVATEVTPEPEATVEETEVFVEATEEVVSEVTEEPTAEVVETETPTVEETPVVEKTPVVVETPSDITSLSEDFESWTGENWTVVDWSVAQVDDSLVLMSNEADATAQVITLDWTTYTIEVDAKVEAGNTLAMTFDEYTLILAADGRNRLSQDDTVIATSPPIENPSDTQNWHHISITKGGTLLEVTVDGIQQYTVAATNSPLGIFAFTATGDQGVSIDNVLMTEVDEDDIQIIEVISTPTPEPDTSEAVVIVIDSSEVTEEPDLLAESTEEPDLLAESTEEPDLLAESTEEPDLLAESTEEPDLLAESTEEPDLLAESTEEPDLLAESTEEPDLLAESTEEPDLLAESTEEPVVDVVDEPVAPDYVVTNVITDDFEGDLSSWNTTASIVEVSDGNHVLLVSTNGQLSPVSSTTALGVVFAGQANILADVDTAGRFTTTLSNAYTVEISTTGITISENGEVVAAVEAAQALNTWFSFSIEVKPEGITVSINDVVVAEYAGTLVLDGNFSVTTNTSVMFEELTVDLLTLEEAEEIEPVATETPELLTQDALNKLGGVAGELIEVFLAGGDDAVADFLATNSDPQDESGRVLVDILASNNYDGATIAQLVSDAGGIVTRTYEHSIEAYVDINTLIVITNHEGIRFIRNISRAISTGPTGPVGNYDGSPSWTEGFNLLSIEEWNLAGVDGDGVKIGVVDTGFKGADTNWGGNIPCLASTSPITTPESNNSGLFDTNSPNIVRDHGTQIIDVICDIAPASDVYMFRADDAPSLKKAITAARNPSNRMDILLITLDLGVNTSAGGGVSGSTNTNIYAEIEAAKNSGMVVIVAAGNNNQRTLVLEIPTTAEGASTSINLRISQGDQVKFGWNDFGDNATVVAGFNVAFSGGGNSDSAFSNDPVLNPLSLTATASGNNISTLTITPSGLTTTAYLQVQIVPIVVGSEIPLSSQENNVKFTGAPTLGGTTLDITDSVGNLGRPADSDHVISVGAICTRPTENPTRWEFSSNGPRFKPNGTPLDAGWDTVITQEEAKPSIMSYSFVSAYGNDGAAVSGPAPVNDLLSCTDGLGGTSASAAHVAGMAALLMSNDDNSSFSGMNEANATTANTFKRVRDYLQSHSIDLPLGAGADGFDITYGAGLSILGAPTYDLTDTVNLGTTPDQLPLSCTTTYYVGQANMAATTINGALTTPFTSIAHALNATTPDCIIVMPGEYVTPIYVENSYASPLLVTGYDDVSRQDIGDVILWLRGLYYYVGSPAEYYYPNNPATPENEGVAYRRRAGLYFGDTSSNVEFSGFTFVAARFFTDNQGSNKTSAPYAVVMDGSTDTTVSNSQFGKFTLNGVEYPGWNNIDATPIQILNEAVGARIADNIFNDNSTNSANFYPTIAIVNSGAVDNPVEVIGNEMYGNSATNQGLADWSAILYSEGSHIDIINNAIHDNDGETIIKIKTTNPLSDPLSTNITATHTRRARIVGNVFLHNESTDTNSGPNLKRGGPLINAHYAPMIYIINNTIVGNTVPTASPFGQLFARGDANNETLDGSIQASTTNAWAFWEIHNNLIYDNTYRLLVGDTGWGTAPGCIRIPNDVSSGGSLYAFNWDQDDGLLLTADASGTFVNRGAQNNWIVGNHGPFAAGAEFGACQDAIYTNKNVSGTAPFKNQNIINADNQPVDSRQLLGGDDSVLARNGDFQGILTPSEEADPLFVPTHTTDDWKYYALADTYISDDNSLENEYSDGIDAAKTKWLTDTGGGDAGDLYMDNADIDFDIIGTKRELEVNNWEINWLTYGYNPSVAPPRGVSNTGDTATYTIDIGAFEYSPLQFEFNCPGSDPDCGYYNTDETIDVETVTYPAQTAGLLEDSGTVEFDFGHIVTGGFGDLTFSINAHPNNYGSQCDPKFEGTKGLVNKGSEGYNELFDYCPPRNFYTSVSNTAPDYVSFEIKVTDEAGAVAIGEIRFTIDPVDDPDLPATPVIGSDAPSTTTFEVVTTLGATPSVRLRPYTRYNNFFFSENNNPDFKTGGQLYVDYPFSYEIESIVEGDLAYPILMGAISGSTVNLDLGENPIIGLELSESDTGTATIIYSITDARGNTSSGNKLVIRSVSIIPDQGIHDDTSFVWNYSDAANAVFYTERADHNATDVPTSGDWKAERLTGAINDTVHSTSTSDDTATFRFIGTGFTLFMKSGSSDGGKFSLNIYDEDTTILSGQDWSQVVGSTAVNEVVIGSLRCTTQADINGNDPSFLRHSLDEYSITCNGLNARKHTVQVVNGSNKKLSVDAFSIINDSDLDFSDPQPIPPGFHDVDNGVLRNAFNDVNWDEAFDTDYSNGVAYKLAVPTPISFTITRASGFAIGTTYRNNNSDFNICVENNTVPSDGICTKVEDNIGSSNDGIHMPFFGLDPAFDYTVTLENMTTNFIFDDLVVFDELMLPDAPLPLGKTLYSDFNITMGKPFGDDWSEKNNRQVIAGKRSAIGPFIAFQMDDSIDMIGITADNILSTSPSGFNGLAVCVGRGNIADAISSTDHYGNCVIIDTQNMMYDNVNSATGEINEDVGTIAVYDGMIVVPESLFGENWGNFGIDPTTVEIFSLYPDSKFEFTAVTLFSTDAGLGEGSYTANTTGISLVEYHHTSGTYTEASIDGSVFKEVKIKECIQYKKGKCSKKKVVGTPLQTTGVGNAILFKMLGTGIAPHFTESAGTFARVCIQEESLVSATTVDAIATEIQDEVQANGGCEILDLSGDALSSPRYINGIKNTTHYVMIELLPSPTNATPTLNFDSLDIVGGDIDGLTALTPGEKYETSYLNRNVAPQMFLYNGDWKTKSDTDNTHSGTTYDETDSAGSSITFKTSGGNVINITRDLKTTTPRKCTGSGSSRVCTPKVIGFSNITVCVAPESNTADRHCSVHKSNGDATQSILPISLNTTFDNSTDYVVSITASKNGFVIDAVEVLDSSTSKMTVGVYQENSSLISYENGQTEILKNTSFENTPLLGGDNWDWGISTGVSASISTAKTYIGSQSVEVQENTSIKSETFDIIQGISYTAVARVNVISGTAEMRSDITGFEVQSTRFTDSWELLHYSFVASTNETVQLEFAAVGTNASFFIDDVHVYKGGAWSFGSGGLTDGEIATSSGYGSQAKFMFTGTGFTVKLASDDSSGETQVCYDNGSTKNCFTYDDEQVSTSDNGHTVVGLDSGDYIVTIQQLDNGLTSQRKPRVCTGSGANRKCTPAVPANRPTDSPTSIKLDYIQIYDDAKPPVLSAGIYNEDAVISNEPGMQLFPANEWEQITGETEFTNESYYQVVGSKKMGSLLALNVDNDPDPVTIIVDINQTNTKATQLLACGNDVDGAIEYNGSEHDIISSNCTLTDQATNQTQLVFNQNDLPALDGSGGETIFTLQSLTQDNVKIDGYQILYGTTLTDGYYEETIGHGISGTNSILTVSSISGTSDWNLTSDKDFSGLNALKTTVSGSTIDFTFDGTGVSIIMKTPTVPNGLVSIAVESSVCGGVCSFDTDTTDIPAIDGAITLAGLPKGIYDVTLTTAIDAGEEVLVDAIEVFGDLQELGSLYDDAQVDVNGTSLLTFGPFWTATTKDTTGKFLNNTNHKSSKLGASVSFVVSGTAGTEAIIIYDGNPGSASSEVEVCWSTTALVRSCDDYDLDDGSDTQRIDAPAIGNYSVSITNKANGEPLTIDAVQVVEAGLMTEGIYQDDYDGFVFSNGYVPVANSDASDGSVMRLNLNQSVTFNFEGVAFSALIVENSPNFDVCAYPTGDGALCGSASAINDLGITKTANTISAVSYGGFHNSDGTTNGAWTVVITNRNSTVLYIDRIDILGNHNELEIADTSIVEANEPQIRYLPFGSWTENTNFKDGQPLNGDRHQTDIPGSIAYFEFNDNISGKVGIEYVRQVKLDKFNVANICYGEVGEPDSMQCESFDNDFASAYQYSSSTDVINPSCVDGCWGFVEYKRESDADNLVPLDYIRLYDPEATLKAGIYQENHPNINVSGTTNTPTLLSLANADAYGGLYDVISSTVGESYFYFAFEGTGLSVRTFEGSDADDISLCVFEYAGGLPNIETALAGSTCLRTYDNVTTEDGFVTRALHGLHHGSQYLAFLKMDSDGSTILGLDQVTIFDKQWFDESDLADSTNLHQLIGGSSYPINFKTRNTDKLVQFLGDWQTVAKSDRALETGATALFRVSGSNAVTVDIALGEEGSFQICAIPMTSAPAPFEVNIGTGATCQTFTQDGRANASFLFSDDLSPHVITIELLSDTWMSLYNVALYDVLNGLGAGLYDQSAPGIQYDSNFETLISEDMESADVDWTTIGTPDTNKRGKYKNTCVTRVKGKCTKYKLVADPHYEGKYARKLVAEIGQGLQYVGISGTDVSLDADTFYTAIAHVYIDPTTPGAMEMRLISGTEVISEVVGLDLSTATRGKWQTIRADFYTEQAYPELILQLVATDGPGTFYIDDVTLTTGGQWANATEDSLFDAYGGNYSQGTTPGASFTFDFVGTGFELGLIAGNQSGEVEVCYHPESNPTDENCFTYSQDDGVPAKEKVCVTTVQGKCTKYKNVKTNTTAIGGRTIVGLPNDTWTVIVREQDDGYELGASKTRNSNKYIFGVDYIYIFEDTDIVTVPPGSYNEDAQDGSNNDYLALYPEDDWKSFNGSSEFTKTTYVAPTVGSKVSSIPGPAALLQVEVDVADEDTAIVFQFGGSTSGFAKTLLICVDETNGKMEWDGTEFSLVDSDNCQLYNNVSSSDLVSITSNEVAVLGVAGTHNVSVSALLSGLFRIDHYQVFNSRSLAAGLHNENLPSTILNFTPGTLNMSNTCDSSDEWCSTKTKTIRTEICTRKVNGVCTRTRIKKTKTTPYIGSAAITSKSGAAANFVIKGTGFSIISDVADNGLDFRVCYKLETSDNSFPALDSDDETLALQGYDGDGLPILISEGGILCENLTTDTDNWDAIMDRPKSSGEQYGFSFYGLPLATYEVQVMVTTPQNEISNTDLFTLDAINVFSDIGLLSELQPGIVDDTNANISYEPAEFWESNSTSSTFERTDSTTNHAGAISQFKAEGNTVILYQTVGNMSQDIQICLLISNENIHCSVEAERQSRIARQVMSFTQENTIIKDKCIKRENGVCVKTSPKTKIKTAYFTPVVFYGLGQDTVHTIIMENRVQGETFNIDAIRVRD